MSSRRKTRQSLTGPGSTSVSSSTPNTSSRKRALLGTSQKDRGPSKRWAKIMRRPAPNVPFQVMKWVPVADLTPDELREWEEMNSRRDSSHGDCDDNIDTHSDGDQRTKDIGDKETKSHMNETMDGPDQTSNYVMMEDSKHHVQTLSRKLNDETTETRIQ